MPGARVAPGWVSGGFGAVASGRAAAERWWANWPPASDSRMAKTAGESGAAGAVPVAMRR